MSRIAAELVPLAIPRAVSWSNGTAGASTWMSIRSSSGPEIFARYFSIARRPTSPAGRSPFGVGFIAATSMKLAGKRSVPFARAIVTT